MGVAEKITLRSIFPLTRALAIIKGVKVLSFLSTKSFKSKYISGSFTENQFICYFFITVLYDAFFHSVHASRISSGDDSIWFQLHGWSFFVCTVTIWLVCFAANGYWKGERLLYKVIPLSITVGFKYAIVMMSYGFVMPYVYPDKPVWFGVFFVYFINLIMLVNIIYHLGSINRQMANK